MTVTLVDTRPSAETGNGNGVYEEGNDDNHVSNNRQPTPDLVPLKHQNAAGNIDVSLATANGLNSEAHASAGVPDNGDVSAVVVKAKRAAQSLWVLIHAQVSRSDMTEAWNCHRACWRRSAHAHTNNLRVT